eukprot:m.544628 g.544628  ORF g.544628 m.544628 type:complete len:670 (-) comp22139_c0_seq3:370-2379(-)
MGWSATKSALCLMSLLHAVDCTAIQVSVHMDTLWQFGNSTLLDRQKFFNIHSAPGTSDWRPEDTVQFAQHYNAHLGRSFVVSGTMSVLPPTASGRVNSTALAAQCAAHPPSLVGWPASNVELITSCKTELYYPTMNTKGFLPRNHSAAAEMWSAFLAACAPPWQSRYICEVANEPNVKEEECNTTWQEMIDLHIAITRRVHVDFPNRSKYLVGGPTEAFPSYELKNFTHWNQTLKPFIDQAGSDVDFLSVHLYDTYFNAAIRSESPDQRNYTERTGSNVDALLDLAEAYSRSKWGRVLPHLVSEFGSSFKNSSFPYKPLHDWYVIRGVGGKMMQLLHRPDTVLKAVPFISGKATWSTGPYPYPYTLWHKAANGQYVLGHLWKLYALWGALEGDYMLCSTSNANVPVVTIRRSSDGAMLLLMHNLLHTPTSATVALLSEMASGGACGAGRSVKIANETRLYLNATTLTPELTVQSSPEAHCTTDACTTLALSLLPGEFRLLVLVEQQPQPQRKSPADAIVLQQTLYCNETVVPITGARQQLVLDGLLAPPSDALPPHVVYATLKLSFAAVSVDTMLEGLAVEFNGHVLPVVVATQLAGKKYIESKTGEFFGTLRIPIPVSLVHTQGKDPSEQSTNRFNSPTQLVTVQFPQSQGFISSVVLLVGTQTLQTD